MSPNGAVFIQLDDPMSKWTARVRHNGHPVPVDVVKWTGNQAFQSSTTEVVIRPKKGTSGPGGQLVVNALGSSFKVRITKTKGAKAPAKLKLMGFEEGTYKTGFPGRQTTHQATWLNVSAISDREPVVRFRAELDAGTNIERALVTGKRATSIRLSPGTSKCVLKAWVEDSARNVTPADVICTK